MKTLLALAIVLGIAALAPSASAQIQDVSITATRKKLDEERNREGGNVTVTAKEIVYTITVENRRFQPQPELRVKYMIFVQDARSGSKEKPAVVVHNGSEKLTNLAANSKASFDTKPITLSEEKLDPGWYYTSGADSKARDRVQGVWVRVYAGDKMIGELANPTTISKKHPWKD